MTATQPNQIDGLGYEDFVTSGPVASRMRVVRAGPRVTSRKGSTLSADLRENLSGVSLKPKPSRLMQLQRSYEAAARVDLGPETPWPKPPGNR